MSIKITWRQTEQGETEQGRQQSRYPGSTHSYEGLEEDNVNERKYTHEEENPTNMKVFNNNKR